jgi:hypothetical protein
MAINVWTFKYLRRGWRTNMVDRKGQYSASHNNQPDPYTADREPLADSCEQQHCCQHHGFSHVVVGVVARLVPLLKRI